MFGDSGSLTDGEFSEWMEEVREDDDIEAVVVRVSSRGGSGLAAAQMWREVARTKAAGKPVVVSFGDYAASGGYLMSCNADAIVSQPGTITGSIGVFVASLRSQVYEKMGMDMHTWRASCPTCSRSPVRSATTGAWCSASTSPASTMCSSRRWPRAGT